MQNEHNTVRRVGLGCGWENTTDKTPEINAVQVRSGNQITTGRIIGDKQEPLAFVWTDEAANDPKRELVICPDLEYTWLWEQGKETTLEAAFPGNKEVQRLERKFRYWQAFLVQHWDAERSQRFFWPRFHQEGVALARKLQALLIKEAVVRYWRPAQDPRGTSEREIQM